MDDARFLQAWQMWQAEDARAEAELLAYCTAYLTEHASHKLRAFHLEFVTSPESITQNVLRRICRVRRELRFERVAAFRAYLNRATRNLLIDLLRKQQRTNSGIPICGGNALAGLAANNVSASNQLFLRELYEAVRWRLTPLECWLADQRAGEISWMKIANNDNEKADKFRNILNTTFKKVADAFIADLEMPGENFRSIDPKAAAARQLQRFYAYVQNNDDALDDQYEPSKAEAWKTLHDEAKRHLGKQKERPIALARVNGLSWDKINTAWRMHNAFEFWRDSFVKASKAMGTASPLLLKSAFEWVEWQNGGGHEHAAGSTETRT